MVHLLDKHDLNDIFLNKNYVLPSFGFKKQIDLSFVDFCGNPHRINLFISNGSSFPVSASNRGTCVNLILFSKHKI